jgi:phage terminase small subunit
MPLSRDPDKRSKQLANLRPGAGAGPPGNRRALAHGGYAAVSPLERDRKAQEIFETLAADAPMRDGAGGLPAADTAVVSLFARCLVQLERVEADMADHGWKDRESGDPRPVVELARRLRGEALDYAEALGMTPRSRAKLGLDLTRTLTAGEALDDHLTQRYGDRGSRDS